MTLMLLQWFFFHCNNFFFSRTVYNSSSFLTNCCQHTNANLCPRNSQWNVEIFKVKKVSKPPPIHKHHQLCLWFCFLSSIIGFVDMLEHMSTNKQLSLSNIFSQKSLSRGISCYMRQQVLDVLRSKIHCWSLLFPSYQEKYSRGQCNSHGHKK